MAVSYHVSPAAFSLVPDPLPSAALALPSNTAAIQVPEPIGKIQESHDGSRGETVIVVQDAHAIPDAQRNIRNLIHFFQKQYGLRLVGVEGATALLDPTIFRSFPDQAMLKKIFKHYRDQGELTGSIAAAILNEMPGIFYGVENWDLYEEGISYFIASKKVQEEILGAIERRIQELSERKEKIYSPELMEIDRALERFYADTGSDFLATLKKLAESRPPAEESELSLLLRTAEQEAGSEQLHTEIRRLSDIIREKLRSLPFTSGLKRDLSELNEKEQAYRIERLSLADLALFLKRLVIQYRIPAGVSPALNRLVNEQHRVVHIESSPLFEEFDRYAESVKESLFSSEAHRVLNRESRKLDLLRRLARLELTYAGWAELQAHFPGSPAAADESAAGFLFNALKPHIAFYRNAEARDHAFIEAIKSRLKDHKEQASLAVVGGFHATGLTDLLKQEGFSYLLIMPGIDSLPEENHYVDQMTGKVSWSSYFQIEDEGVNVYEAFVRATRDQLLRGSETEPGVLLRDWRDQIIRDLAAQNRIEEARKYTVFIDETIPEKAGRETPWVDRVNRFLSSVEELEKRGNLTPANITEILRAGLNIQAASVSLGISPESSSRILTLLSRENQRDLFSEIAGRIQQGEDPSAVVREILASTAASTQELLTRLDATAAETSAPAGEPAAARQELRDSDVEKQLEELAANRGAAIITYGDGAILSGSVGKDSEGYFLEAASAEAAAGQDRFASYADKDVRRIDGKIRIDLQRSPEILKGSSGTLTLKSFVDSLRENRRLPFQDVSEPDLTAAEIEEIVGAYFPNLSEAERDSSYAEVQHNIHVRSLDELFRARQAIEQALERERGPPLEDLRSRLERIDQVLNAASKQEVGKIIGKPFVSSRETEALVLIAAALEALNAAGLSASLPEVREALQNLAGQQRQASRLITIGLLMADGIVRTDIYRTPVDQIDNKLREQARKLNDYVNAEGEGDRIPINTEDNVVDTVIVGGGPHGLATALRLIAEGRRVVVLEAGFSAQGFTDALMQSVHWMRTNAYESSLVRDSIPEFVRELGLDRNITMLRLIGQLARQQLSEATGQSFTGLPPFADELTSIEAITAPAARNELYQHFSAILKFIDDHGGFIQEQTAAMEPRKITEGPHAGKYAVTTSDGYTYITEYIHVATGFVGPDADYIKQSEFLNNLESARNEAGEEVGGLVAVRNRGDVSDPAIVSQLAELNAALERGDTLPQQLALPVDLLGDAGIKNIVSRLPAGSNVIVVGTGESAVKAVVELVNLNPKITVDAFYKDLPPVAQLHIPGGESTRRGFEEGIVEKEKRNEWIRAMAAYQHAITNQTGRDLQALEFPKDGSAPRLRSHVVGAYFDENSMELRQTLREGRLVTEVLMRDQVLRSVRRDGKETTEFNQDYHDKVAASLRAGKRLSDGTFDENYFAAENAENREEIKALRESILGMETEISRLSEQLKSAEGDAAESLREEISARQKQLEAEQRLLEYELRPQYGEWFEDLDGRRRFRLASFDGIAVTGIGYQMREVAKFPFIQNAVKNGLLPSNLQVTEATGFLGFEEGSVVEVSESKLGLPEAQPRFFIQGPLYTALTGHPAGLALPSASAHIDAIIELRTQEEERRNTGIYAGKSGLQIQRLKEDRNYQAALREEESLNSGKLNTAEAAIFGNILALIHNETFPVLVEEADPRFAYKVIAQEAVVDGAAEYPVDDTRLEKNPGRLAYLKQALNDDVNIELIPNLRNYLENPQGFALKLRIGIMAEEARGVTIPQEYKDLLTKLVELLEEHPHETLGDLVMHPSQKRSVIYMDPNDYEKLFEERSNLRRSRIASDEQSFEPLLVQALEHERLHATNPQLTERQVHSLAPVDEVLNYLRRPVVAEVLLFRGDTEKYPEAKDARLIDIDAASVIEDAALLVELEQQLLYETYKDTFKPAGVMSPRIVVQIGHRVAPLQQAIERIKRRISRLDFNRLQKIVPRLQDIQKEDDGGAFPRFTAVFEDGKSRVEIYAPPGQIMVKETDIETGKEAAYEIQGSANRESILSDIERQGYRSELRDTAVLEAADEQLIEAVSSERVLASDSVRGSVVDISGIFAELPESLQDLIAGQITQLDMDAFVRPIGRRRMAAPDDVRSFRQLLSDPSLQTHVLVDNDGIVRGYTMAELKESSASAELKFIATTHEALLPASERTGVTGRGTFLMNTLLETLQEKGILAVNWQAASTTNQGNSAAFYERYLGYESVRQQFLAAPAVRDGDQYSILLRVLADTASDLDAAETSAEITVLEAAQTIIEVLQEGILKPASLELLTRRVTELSAREGDAGVRRLLTTIRAELRSQQASRQDLETENNKMLELAVNEILVSLFNEVLGDVTSRFSHRASVAVELEGGRPSQLQNVTPEKMQRVINKYSGLLDRVIFVTDTRLPVSLAGIEVPHTLERNPEAVRVDYQEQLGFLGNAPLQEGVLGLVVDGDIDAVNTLTADALVETMLLVGSLIGLSGEKIRTLGELLKEYPKLAELLDGTLSFEEQIGPDGKATGQILKFAAAKFQERLIRMAVEASA